MTSNYSISELIKKCAFTGRDLTPYVKAAGEARVVMIGEASHGTHEFYTDRVEITKRLIKEKGVTIVAVEADWPDAWLINKFVRGKGKLENAKDEALKRFKRFPRWMWRNEEVLDFVVWLRKWNDKLEDPSKKVGFYGLDLYSLFESAHEVLKYLKERDPESYKRAKHRYSCFDHYNGDTQSYGFAANFGFGKSCEDCVTKQLIEMHKKSITKLSELYDGEELFYAQLNAKVVKDAEEYYRSMFTKNTWNLRDKHMVETLDELIKHERSHRGLEGKAVVWAHNSHVGDASATDAKKRKETNIGELVRKRYGLESTFNIGFSTYTGTVYAAEEWDGEGKARPVRPGLKDSYEDVFHSTGINDFGLIFRSNDANINIDKELNQELSNQRLERAIGVIYRPDTERMSHYFFCDISRQFDAVIHIDVSKAITPLDKNSYVNPKEPETYPSGM